MRASACTTDENTLENPTKVAPVEEAIENASQDFRRTLPGNSVTVIRLTTK